MELAGIWDCLLPLTTYLSSLPTSLSSILQLPSALPLPPVQLHGRQLRLVKQVQHPDSGTQGAAWGEHGGEHSEEHTPPSTPTTPTHLCYASPRKQHISLLCHHLATVFLNSRIVRVLHKLGEGGYAFVYLCKEVGGSGEDEYALKKVLAGSEEALEAAKREAAIQQQARHPCILPLLDWAVVPPAPTDPAANHTVYLLSPAYPDGTLADELQRLATLKLQARAGGLRAPAAAAPAGANVVGCVLSTRQVLLIFKQLCEALDALHAQGYAHRDVKVHNLLIQRPAARCAHTMQQGSTSHPEDGHSMARAASTGSGYQHLPGAAGQNGGGHGGGGGDAEAGRGHGACDYYRVCLMDFGSARQRTAVLNTRSEALRLQEDAAAHCTATFRAPELWDTPSPALLDQAACDVWAVGCTLYAAMYGQSPFQVALNQGGSLALAVMNCSIPWPKDSTASYPLQLHDLVQRCLAHDPAQRPSAALLVGEVADLLAVSPALPDPQDYRTFARAMAWLA